MSIGSSAGMDDPVISKKKIATSTILVASGDLLVKIISLGTTILLMRIFSPGDYGIIFTMLTLMSILPVFLDFGTGSSVIRFGPLLSAQGRENERSDLFRGITFLRILLSILVITIGFPLSRFLANLLLHDESRFPIVMIAITGGVFTAFFQLSLNIFQSEEKFIWLTWIKNADAFTKLIIVLICVSFLTVLDPMFVMIIYMAGPAMALILSLPKMYTFFRNSWKYLGKIKPLIEFNSWYMIANICLMIFTNFDVMIVAALCREKDVGYFGAGSKLASILFLIVNALFTVLMPLAGKQKNAKDLLRTVRKITIGCFITSLLMIPLVFTGSFLIPLLAGESYIPATGVFNLIAWDHICMVLFTPFMITLFVINRPKIIALFSALEMIINIVGDLIVVPVYGPAGAAAVTLITRFLIGSIGSGYLYYKLIRDPEFVRVII